MPRKYLVWLCLVAPLWAFAACGIAERTVEERSDVAGAPGRLSSSGGGNAGNGGTAGRTGNAGQTGNVGGAGKPESTGTCRSDADCSVEGDVCIGEKTSAHGIGQCGSIGDCSFCEPGQCVTINGYQFCGPPCTQDADCHHGRCGGLPPPSKRKVDSPSVGYCQDGVPEVTCTSNDDCDGHLCIPVYPDSGVCSNGLPGDSCSTNSQCTPPICMLVAPPSEANAPAAALPPQGTCGSGELGAPCWGDEYCFSGKCDSGLCGPARSVNAEAGSGGKGGTSATNAGGGGA